MAKLTSIVKFSGTLDGLSPYKTEGVEETILRKSGGPTKDQVLHAPQFALTRKNNKETGGCSRASGFVMETLGALRPLCDQSCAGRLNALLKPLQEADTQSAWGRRHVLLTQNPRLLEGFALRKTYPPGGRAGQLHGLYCGQSLPERGDRAAGPVARH